LTAFGEDRSEDGHSSLGPNAFPMLIPQTQEGFSLETSTERLGPMLNFPRLEVVARADSEDGVRLAFRLQTLLGLFGRQLERRLEREPESLSHVPANLRAENPGRLLGEDRFFKTAGAPLLSEVTNVVAAESEIRFIPARSKSSLRGTKPPRSGAPSPRARFEQRATPVGER
jgi:hypothetical protein